MDQILPVIYMIGVLLLVLPAFLSSNSKLKQLLTNLTIWIIIILVILTFIFIAFNEDLLYEKITNASTFDFCVKQFRTH